MRVWIVLLTIGLICPHLDAQSIAAGNIIQVRLLNGVTTKSAEAGNVVTANVDVALKNGSDVVIPAGARLFGRVDFVQRKSVDEDGWLRLLFNRFELADGRAVDTLASASFHYNNPRSKMKRVATILGLAGIGAVLAGDNKRITGGLGGAIVGLVLTENRNRYGRDLTLRSGKTIQLRLVDDLNSPAK